MGVKKLYKNIKRGKLGQNIGISTGMPKLDSVIYGIQKNPVLHSQKGRRTGKNIFSYRKVFLTT